MEQNRGQAAIPPAFFEKMKPLMGEEYEAFAEALLKGEDGMRYRALRIDPRRANPAEVQEAGFTLTPVPWAKDGYFYPEEERPGRHPFHNGGLYYIQEPSAMAVFALGGVEPGERVLDLCAAPGGKSTAIAAGLAGTGILVSNEIIPGRAKILSSNIERMGIANAIVTNEPSDRLANRFENYFDRIYVDAPCSGEGMFRKEEAARTEWSPENVEICAARQREILENADRMLCDGGVLVYSTCTFAPEENENTIASFLEAHPDYHVLPAIRTATEKGAGDFTGFDAGRPSFLTRDYGEEIVREIENTVRLWPHRIPGEGHFAAVLKKDGETSRKISEDNILTADREAKKLLHGFLRETLTAAGLAKIGEAEASFDKRVIRNGDELYLMPQRVSLSGLKVLRPGLDLGTVKKDRFEPAHALALCLTGEDVKMSYDLPAEDAQIEGYLRGNTVVTEDGKNRKGFTLLLASGHAAGWTKASGSVLKNHYPKGLRIMG